MDLQGRSFSTAARTDDRGVVTLNMPRLGYLSNTKEELFNSITRLMDLAADSLIRKRKVIQELYDGGMYPYTKSYLSGLHNHFNTIGVVGVNECILNFAGTTIDTLEGRELGLEILDFMRERLEYYQTTKYVYNEKHVATIEDKIRYNKFGFNNNIELNIDNINVMDFGPFNLEATPAESTTYRLAKIDVEKYGDKIITAGMSNDDPYYTNSTHLPVDSNVDIIDAMTIQDEFQTKYTGGTVFHGYLGESIDDWHVVANLVKNMCSNFRMPYMTVSPIYTICPKCGYIKGAVEECPVCKSETEIYDRITGYYRPIKNWNKGKVSEYQDRTEYTKLDSVRDKKTYSKVLLFTKPNCPKCPSAVELLNDNDIEHQALDATHNDNKHLVERYKVKVTPTAILINPKNGSHVFLESVEEMKDILAS